MAGSPPNCAACGAELPAGASLGGGDRLHGLPGRFEVAVCPRCGSGRTRPHVPTGELGALYPRDYNAHSLPEAGAARAAATALYRWRYFRALRRLPLRALAEREPGRLLDVGGGRGDLGVVMGKRGWHVTGLEPSEEACRDARERGVRMVAGTLSATPPDLGGDYDAAAFQHSLEHVAEPADDLEAVRELLRPGGLVAISLPNFGSSQARRFGADWFHLDLPRHRTHFTPAGLEALLRRAGFEVEAVTTSSSADGLPMSLRYRRGYDGAGGGYATTAAVLALSPAGSALDRASGGGDLLHALADPPPVSPGADIELSVVLVNHDGADCLPAALDALAANTAEGAVECVVIDSASADGSWRGVEERWDRARAERHERNIGFCAGCNRGAALARGRLVAFVNFDGEVEPGWDVPLAERLEDPGVSVATGLALRPDGETLESAGLEIAPTLAAYARLEGRPRSEAPAEATDVATATGGLMMVRRDEFLAWGGFHEPLWMYGEETDLGLRVPGRVVLDPRSAFRHAAGHAAGPPRSALRLYWHARNRLVNAARHLPAGRLAAAVALDAAFDLLTLAQVRTGEALSATARGWRDGLGLMRAERAARTPEQRRQAARRVGSLRDALAQQRALGRMGTGRPG